MPMPSSTTEPRSERLEQVVALLRAKLSADQREVLEAFARQYFGQVDPEDLDERAAADLYGGSYSATWQSVQKARDAVGVPGKWS